MNFTRTSARHVRKQTQPRGNIDHLTAPLPSFDKIKSTDRSRQSDRTLIRFQALSSLSHRDRTAVQTAQIQWLYGSGLVIHLHLAPKYTMRVEFYIPALYTPL
jgi:hypothetical protein